VHSSRGSYYNIVTHTGNSHLAFRGSSRVPVAISRRSTQSSGLASSSRRDRRFSLLSVALLLFTSPNSSISCLPDLDVYVAPIVPCREYGVTAWGYFLEINRRAIFLFYDNLCDSRAVIQAENTRTDESTPPLPERRSFLFGKSQRDPPRMSSLFVFPFFRYRFPVSYESTCSMNR